MRYVALVIALLGVSQTPTLDDVVARLDAYQTAYEPKLSELIADEVMDQVIRRGLSVATYKNFRRFQTSARIVPPPGAQ